MRRTQPKLCRCQQASVALDYNPAYNDTHVNSRSYDQHQQIEPYYTLVTEAEDECGTGESYVEIERVASIN